MLREQSRNYELAARSTGGIFSGGQFDDVISQEESVLLYMIVEHFKNHDPVPVYQRFREQGRLAPIGLEYVSSWVDEKLDRCFQLMETDDRRLLDEWISNWSDLAEFEVVPVISSSEAAARVDSAVS